MIFLGNYCQEECISNIYILDVSTIRQRNYGKVLLLFLRPHQSLRNYLESQKAVQERSWKRMLLMKLFSKLISQETG